MCSIKFTSEHTHVLSTLLVLLRGKHEGWSVGSPYFLPEVWGCPSALSLHPSPVATLTCHLGSPLHRHPCSPLERGTGLVLCRALGKTFCAIFPLVMSETINKQPCFSESVDDLRAMAVCMSLYPILPI